MQRIQLSNANVKRQLRPPLFKKQNSERIWEVKLLGTYLCLYFESQHLILTTLNNNPKFYMLNTLPKFRSKALMYNCSHFLSASGLSAVCFGMRESSCEFRFIPFQLISPATESCKHRLRLRVALGFPKESGKS